MIQEYGPISQGLVYLSLASLAGAYILKTIRDCRIVDRDLAKIEEWRTKRDKSAKESRLPEMIN